MLIYWTDDNPTRRDVPIPTDYAWELNDLDKNSGRNDFGLMFREVIGKKNKLTLKWALMVESDAFKSFVRWAKDIPPFVYIQFIDPAGDLVEMECYCSKLSTSLYAKRGDTCIWKDFSMSFVER